ncbi:MAG: bifunctional tetrahydrofolate synthase/dihydrofolate synthase [Gammaproteobacteria bacterium]|nr:bifunctional tetrahydrofolate synthase/dihydrofolate synthase [Gammaproteobacteria bacterium]
MRFNTLEGWLGWQESLHPIEIDLGLERVSAVLAQLNPGHPDFTLITIAGTNGKGSSVAMLEAILLAAGYQVGSYTSPHLLRYNERIKLDGRPVDDAMLCASFERIDQARANVRLTFFEFGTLAAIDILHRAGVDVAILEVGLGGRLDAVNVLDADVALVTAIDVDHVDWLGCDRETIAREKAGILRTGRPAVCADPQPPASLLAVAESLEVSLLLLGKDFFIERFVESSVESSDERKADRWSWNSSQCCFEDLPLPALSGDFQLRNAAGVLAVLSTLRADFPVDAASIAQGLQSVSLPGRFQIMPGVPLQIYDVAHNAQSAQALANNLAQQDSDGRHFSGQTHAVLGMLADKDIDTVIAQLWPVVDHWYLAPLPAPRSAPVAQLRAALLAADIATNNTTNNASIESFDDVTAAYQAALAASTVQDRIVVTGSFYTVAAVLGEAV